MTRFQEFKNGRWIHSENILDQAPDVNFYRVQAGVYAWADNTQPTTYVAADRGLALGVGVTPSNWTHDAGAGITSTFRTQSAFAGSGAQGGDLIVRVGAGDGVGRYGSFSVPGVGANSENFGLASSAAGNNSLAIGNAAKAPAANSIVVGASAANATFSGTNQVVIGYSSGSGLTSGGSNTICGADAGDTLTTGGSNCLYGYNAETLAVDTAQSVGIGHSSVVASNSVVIGYSATTNTVGVLVIGHSAAANGATQTVVGNSAKGGTGADGVVIGYAAANSGAFTGGNCVIIGNSAASNITSGNLNTILGSDSGDLLTTGSQNVLVGFNCETTANSTSNAVAVGSVLVVASTSVAIGDTVTASAVNSVVIGCLANGGTAAATNGVVIGDNAANGGFTGTKNVLIGSSVATALTSGGANTICGADAGDTLTTGGENCLFGYNAETAAANTFSSVGIGINSVVATDSVAVGNAAKCAAIQTVVIGANAGNSTFDTGETVIVGYGAGQNLGTVYGGLNTICGSSAGNTLVGGSAVSIFGYNANVQAAGTTNAVGIGASSVTNDRSVAIGAYAKTSTWTDSIVLGYDATATDSNQFVVGSGSSYVDNAYFGNGSENSGPVSCKIRATGSTGASAGANLTVAGGVSTSGIGGYFRIQVAPSTTLVDAMIVSPIKTGGSVLTNAASFNLMNSAYQYQNNTYTTVAGKTGGIVINYLPTATTTTVAGIGFTAGVAGVSNPTIGTTGAATFAAADLIQISGAWNPSNNGLFEVLSHAANVLTIRGVGLTACVEAFTQNQLVTDSDTAGTITKVGVSVIRAGTDGIWETGRGNVTPISFADIGTGTVTGSGTLNRVAKFTAATVVGDSSITDTGALVTVSVPLTVPGAGANSERFGNATTAAGADSVVIGYAADGGTALATDGVVIGANAANATFSGANQVVIGSGAGSALTSSSGNVLIGRNAGNQLTSGGDNVCIGAESDLSGGIVSAIVIGGDASTQSNLTVNIGYQSRFGSGAARGVAVGYLAGTSGVVGGSNIFVGASSGSGTTSGSQNVFIGDTATGSVATVTNAVAIGHTTTTNTTSVAIGAAVTANAVDSVVIGYSARGGTSAATSGVMIGANAANATFSGTNQVLIGSSVGSALTSGASNTICGADAGDILTTGGSNCLFGYNAETQAAGTATSVGIGANVVVHTSSIAIGSGATTTASNQFSAGSSTSYISDVYFGNGVSNAAPITYTIHGTDSSGGAAGGDLNIAGGGSASGAGGYVRIQTTATTVAGLTTRQEVSPSGDIIYNHGVRTTGSPTMARWNAAAHTTLTASVEAIDINFNLARTVQFATGALTTQRAFVIQAPTYGFVGASTITTAATFAITGAPVAGTNATITNALALWVQAGYSRFDGGILLGEPAADQTAGASSVFDVVTVGETVSFGEILYLKSDGKWWKADADQATTMPGLRMALATITADNTGLTLVNGRVRHDFWNWTVGGAIYADTTSGALTQTAPSGTGDQVQIVGYAYHADKMLFMPSSTLVEVA